MVRVPLSGTLYIATAPIAFKLGIARWYTRPRFEAATLAQP
jgi:hypothetical protein